MYLCLYVRMYINTNGTTTHALLNVSQFIEILVINNCDSTQANVSENTLILRASQVTISHKRGHVDKYARSCTGVLDWMHVCMHEPSLCGLLTSQTHLNSTPHPSTTPSARPPAFPYPRSMLVEKIYAEANV